MRLGDCPRQRCRFVHRLPTPPEGRTSKFEPPASTSDRPRRAALPPPADSKSQHQAYLEGEGRGQTSDRNVVLNSTREERPEFGTVRFERRQSFEEDSDKQVCYN